MLNRKQITVIAIWQWKPGLGQRGRKETTFHWEGAGARVDRVNRRSLWQWPTVRPVAALELAWSPFLAPNLSSDHLHTATKRLFSNWNNGVNASQLKATHSSFPLWGFWCCKHPIAKHSICLYMSCGNQNYEMNALSVFQYLFSYASSSTLHPRQWLGQSVIVLD